ncbi:MAG: TldD/PmbA family protein [Ignavibacteriae bacterium]|nr:MAG: TldD/PmbA family protein [Ignavibacteriota bacterium]
MILNQEEAKKILSKVISYSKADSISTSISGSNTYNLRYALNSLSTNGFADGLSLNIVSNVGRKSGSVRINIITDESIKAAVEKSENIAKISPENKEFMPPLEPQTYSEGVNYSLNTENITSAQRAEKLEYILDESIKRDLQSAGYLEDEVSFYAIMNSKGLFAYNKGTMSSYSSTVRTKSGTGSSRVQNQYVDISNLDTVKLSDKVLNRSVLSENPAELPPGKYTVILEPAAAADLVTYGSFFMDARSADEGRSFFSKKEGGNKIGEQVADSKVTIYSNPIDPVIPVTPFTGEGYPLSKTMWIENGILKNLSRGRFWAEKTGQPIMPGPANIIMEGTDKSVDDLIAGTDRGILVTRFWYIRTVDPQTMLLTGLTRDGLFEIVDGKITRSIKNFRFNESPMNMLSNVIEIGKSENAVGAETDNTQIFVPALKVRDFYFSSLSDAI